MRDRSIPAPAAVGTGLPRGRPVRSHPGSLLLGDVNITVVEPRGQRDGRGLGVTAQAQTQTQTQTRVVLGTWTCVG